MYKIIAVILAFVILTKCDNIFNNKCTSDNIDCVERELVRYIDKIETKSVPIIGDYLILGKIDEHHGDVTGRSNEGFIDRCIRYLASHELKFRIPVETGRSLIAEARSSKLKKIILPLLLLLKLKAAIIIPAVLSVIALVAFKGLGASLIALAISGATGLKSLLEGHNSSKFTYEVVPQIAPSHWSRSGVDPIAAISPLNAGYHTLQ